MTSSLRLLALLATLAAAPAAAETQDEMAFGLGQFTGAATYCKIPREKVQKVAAAMLASQDIDSSAPGPAMTRFTEGVAEGIRAMSSADAAPCADVAAAFEAVLERID